MRHGSTAIAAAFAIVAAMAAATPALAQTTGNGIYSTKTVPLSTGAGITTVPLYHAGDYFNRTDVETFTGGNVTTTGSHEGTYNGPYIYTPNGQLDSSTPYAFALAGSVTVNLTNPQPQQYFGALIQYGLGGGSVDTLSFYKDGAGIFSMNLTAANGVLVKTVGAVNYYASYFNFDAVGANAFNQVVLSSTVQEVDMSRIQYSTTPQTFLADSVPEPAMTGLPMMAMALVGMTGLAVRRRRG